MRPTYLLRRGNLELRGPEVQPGVPAIFGVDQVSARTVELPLEAWSPALKPAVIEGLANASVANVLQAEAELHEHRQRIAALQLQLQQLVAGTPASQRAQGTVFHERFDQLRPDIWTVLTGQWDHEAGKLVQKVPGSFVTIAANVSIMWVSWASGELLLYSSTARRRA